LTREVDQAHVGSNGPAGLLRIREDYRSDWRMAQSHGRGRVANDLRFACRGVWVVTVAFRRGVALIAARCAGCGTASQRRRTHYPDGRSSNSSEPCTGIACRQDSRCGDIFRTWPAGGRKCPADT
jgi:hypothetical protein